MGLIKKIAAIIFILCPAFYFGVNEQPIEMGIILTASSVLMFFLNLDKFKSFRVGNLEANMFELKNDINMVAKKIDSYIDSLSQKNLSLAKDNPTIPNIDFCRDSDIVLEDIERRVKYLKEAIVYIYQTAIEKEEILISFLKENKIDTKTFEGQNSLSSCLFETYCLGANNNFEQTLIDITIIKYNLLKDKYESDTTNTDIQKELENAKNQLKEMASSSSIAD